MQVLPQAVIPPGAVLLDNLTLQSAFRSLVAVDGALPSDELPYDHISRSDKWDYEANSNFRSAIDLVCLAQLLQAIVINERIVIDPRFMSRWSTERWSGGVDATPSGADVMPDIARGLEEIVVPLPLEEDAHRIMLARASESALKYSRTTIFEDYLGMLSAEWC